MGYYSCNKVLIERTIEGFCVSTYDDELDRWDIKIFLRDNTEEAFDYACKKLCELSM